MSAEILRRAASLMRARAEAASSGDWEIRHSIYVVPTGPTPKAVIDCDEESDATHIASWHPAVAFAVADWLDADADVIERHELDVTISRAYDVARAYLGESA